ncbi:DNA helicase [Tanacetum coccineum]
MDFQKYSTDDTASVLLHSNRQRGKESEFHKHHFKFTAYNQLQSKVPYRDEDSKLIYPILTNYLGCICSISNVKPSGNANIRQKYRRKVDIESLDKLAKEYKKDKIEKLPRLIIIAVSSYVQLETTPATFYYINPQTQKAANAYTMFKEKYEFNPPLQVCKYRYVDPEQEKTRNRQTLYTLLQQDLTSFKGPAKPNLRYNFKATVIDGTATAEFTFFTEVGQKITGHPCSHLMQKFKATDKTQLPIEMVNTISLMINELTSKDKGVDTELATSTALTTKDSTNEDKSMPELYKM